MKNDVASKPAVKPAKPTEDKKPTRKSEAGKGDAPRPISVPQEEYDLRWQLIFCRDKRKRNRIIKEIEKLKQRRIEK